ncbi:MAG: NUDIX hydrolase [Lachnospiraceae bacterium]|nr:NUDIX hydrolase [Lachnospiraceae bacterium]
MEEIKRIGRELKHAGAIVDFFSDSMEMPDGNVVQWDLIHHRKGAAAVIPVMPDGKILMVRQFRNALDRITLEIPAGARDDSSEDTAVCAARELEEETGYKAGKITYLLSLRPTVAYCDEFIDVYLAEDISSGQKHPDEYEFIEIEMHDLDELVERIYRGEIQDGKTVAAILALKCKGLL